jgi:iron complex transport system ATP-binding protein
MNGEPVLSAKEFSIGYGQGKRVTVIAEQLDLSLNSGEVVCLLGPNGVGKSTLIRTLAGMQPPLAGQVTIGGDDISRLDRMTLAQRISVMLTDRTIPMMMTAREMVSLGRFPHTNWLNQFSQADHQAVENALNAVGAAGLADRLLSELSDGERQKVMIARSLAQQPLVLMMDEPTAFLDLPRRIEMMYLLKRVASETACAVLLSTHDLDLALRHADQVWLMWENGQLATGTAAELLESGAFNRAFGVLFDEFYQDNRYKIGA